MLAGGWNMRRLLPSPLALIASTALVAGCTVAGGTPEVTPLPSPARSFVIDPSPSALVLRVDTGGGLVPASYRLDHLPEFSLYGDGRIVVSGPVDLRYPSPLLPNMRQLTITPAEIQAILGAADTAGLLGADARFDASGIFDVSTTTFTTSVAGRTHVVSAYALGWKEAKASDNASELARAKLAIFTALVSNLPAALGRALPDEAYSPDSMRVLATPADPYALPPASGKQTIDWPLAVDPATGGLATGIGSWRCLVLDGTDLGTFTAAARSATVFTTWRASGGEFKLLVRPNLPDESGCGKAGT
jgi:hypothetical protein